MTLTLTLSRVITLCLCIAILAPGRGQANNYLKYQRGNLKHCRDGHVTQVKQPLPPLVYDTGTFGKFIRWFHKPQSHELLRADGTPYSHYKLVLTESHDKLGLESLQSWNPAESNHLFELAKIRLPQDATVTLVFDSNTFEVKYPHRLAFWKKHVNIRVHGSDRGFRLYLKPIRVQLSYKVVEPSWTTKKTFKLPPLAFERQHYQLTCWAVPYSTNAVAIHVVGTVFLPKLLIKAAENTAQRNPVAAFLVATKDGNLRAVEETPQVESLEVFHDDLYEAEDTKVFCPKQKGWPTTYEAAAYQFEVQVI